MIKFLRFRKLKNKKNSNKYEIILVKHGKFITRKFGKKIKNLKNIKTKDPTNIKILTKFILANKPTLSGGLADYKRRLKIYNKTGRFPMNIKGSKRLKSIKSKNKKSKYGLLRNFREKIYNVGDRLGSRRLKNLGLDPDDRIFEEKMSRMFPAESYKTNEKYNRTYILGKKLKESANKLRQNASRRIQKIFNTNPKRYQLAEYPDCIEMSNLFGYTVPKNVVNKKLYLSIKNKIKKSIKGRRWGAYDSGRLVKMYKNSGGKYTGKKGKTNLGRWYSEKWIDACAWPKRKSCGRKTKSSIAYCRPSKRIDSKTPMLIQSLTRSQIRSRCARKKRINRLYNRF
jgi:hypothetical protein